MRQVGAWGRAALTVGCLLVGNHDAVARRAAPAITGYDDRHPAPLQKAVGDADATDAALKTLGFDISALQTLDDHAATRALALYVGRIEAGDRAVVFFSRGSVAINGRSYLLPVDLDEPEPDRILLSHLRALTLASPERRMDTPGHHRFRFPDRPGISGAIPCGACPEIRARMF